MKNYTIKTSTTDKNGITLNQLGFDFDYTIIDNATGIERKVAPVQNFKIVFQGNY